MTYKLQTVLMSEGDITPHFQPLYFDVKNIQGFYMSYGEQVDDDVHNLVIIQTPCNEFAIKDEPHIREYLMNRFVDSAITP